MSSLMEVVNTDARQLVDNAIIQSMTVIDWERPWLGPMRLFRRNYLYIVV